MKPPINPTIMYFEVISLIITIFACFLIFFYTKKIYKLTEHKGINYFRKGFLFLGISYSIFLIEHIFRIIGNLPLFYMRNLFQLIFILFQIIGIGYLLSSMYSKKIKEYLIFLTTSIIFILSFLFETKLLIFIYGTLLIIALGIISYIKITKKEKKHFSQIYIIYLLIFLTWLLHFFGRVFDKIYEPSRLFIEIFSAIIFMYMLYLVINKLNIKK